MGSYAFGELKENMARAMSRDLAISTKVSIEVSTYLKGRTVEKAKLLLEQTLENTHAIPFKRFTNGVGHRKGANIASGRYPEKASLEFLNLLNAVEANAQAKGLSTDLLILHLAAQKGTNQYRSGRQRRRMFKRTHLEIVVEEQEKKATPKKKEELKKTEEKKVPKEEEKIQVPKEESKKTPETKEEVKKPETKEIEKKVPEKKETVKEPVKQEAPKHETPKESKPKEESPKEKTEEKQK